MTDIIERLIQDHQQLRKMSEAACFAGKETGVRVKDPSALLEDLDDAVAEITKLRAERDAAARDMRERCAKVADERAKQYDSEAADWQNDGNTRTICTAIAVRLKGCGREIRALPTSVIATEGNGRD